MKLNKGFYYIGMICSMLVGAWHFTVPWVYQWGIYIPEEYSNLTVLIDWINMLFSLFLFGLSLILILWGKKIFAGNKEAITIFGFMVFVLIFRVIIAIVEPYPASVLPVVAYGQLAGCAIVMILLLISFIYVIKTKAFRGSK